MDQRKLLIAVINFVILVRPLLEVLGDSLSLFGYSFDSLVLGVCLLLIVLLVTYLKLAKMPSHNEKFGFIIFAMALYILSSSISVLKSQQMHTSMTEFLDELLLLLIFFSIIRYYELQEAIHLSKLFLISVSFYAIDIVLDVVLRGGRLDDQGMSYLRASGYFTNLGGWIFGVIFLYGIYVCFVRLQVTGSGDDKRRRLNMMILFLFVFMLVSGSRSSILSFFLFLVTYFVLNLRTKAQVLKTAFLFLLVAVIGITSLRLIDPDGFKRFMSVFDPNYYDYEASRGGSAAYRLILISYYLFGEGISLFGYGQRAYYFVFGYTDPGSLYVGTAMTLGIVGVITYFTLFWSIFIYGLRRFHIGTSKVLIAIMVSMVLLCGGESATVGIRGYYFWAMVGIIIKVISESVIQRRQPAPIGIPV